MGQKKNTKRTLDALVKCKMYFNKLRAMSHVKASSPRGEVRHYSLLMFTTTLNGDVKQSHLISFRPPHLVICFKQKKKASVSTSCVVTYKLWWKCSLDLSTGSGLYICRWKFQFNSLFQGDFSLLLHPFRTVVYVLWICKPLKHSRRAVGELSAVYCVENILIRAWMEFERRRNSDKLVSLISTRAAHSIVVSSRLTVSPYNV